ncbi:MAG: GTP-binding protein, partial [Phycisphaerae bacterium]
HRDEVRAAVRAACEALERALQTEIQAAARELYELLCQRPALLNTLRAARATADVASVALAIKTGGVGAHDLLYAPAMLAFSTLLTEGALGSYMGQVAENLKKRQLAAARRTLIDEQWRPRLARLKDALDAPGVFGIDAPSLADAAAALADFERVIRDEPRQVSADPPQGGPR